MIFGNGNFVIILPELYFNGDCFDAEIVLTLVDKFVIANVDERDCDGWVCFPGVITTLLKI